MRRRTTTNRRTSVTRKRTAVRTARKATGPQRKRRIVSIVCVCVVYVPVCVLRGEQLVGRGRGGWYV